MMENGQLVESTIPEIVVPDVVVDSREPEELYQAISKALEGKIVVREAASTDIIIPGGFALMFVAGVSTQKVRNSQGGREDAHLLRVSIDDAWVYSDD